MKVTRVLRGAGIISSFGSMGAGASTLVEDDRRILVDTGHFGNRDVLVRNLKELGIETSEIDTIVLTHLNWDHCLNIDLFENAEIVLGKEEFISGTLSGTADKITAGFKEYLNTRKIRTVSDGNQVSRNTHILATPGHTPGHVSLNVSDGKKTVLISGDAMPNLRSYRRGVPDIIFYNLDLARKSIDKIRKLNPDVIIPGHDPPFNSDGYIERDTVDISMRNEDETNLVVTIGKKEAPPPVIYNE
ncbi:Metallo-beta-lactamase superfamily protein [Thermoplasmatales archaeon]|nr:Metallo-beta-lactamase superfamily protein [Thermoplasmatales archaeon]